jgi:hypothetical protein
MRAELSEDDADAVYRGLRFPATKPPALVTIDDRAVTFDGSFPDIPWLLGFKTWQGK